MLEPPRQDDMAVEPIRSWRDLGKGHAHLKSDPGFLGQNTDRSKRADGRNNVIEQRAELRPFTAEMMREIVAATGVRLIAVREKAPALATLPK
jgi:hypothetical protein